MVAFPVQTTIWRHLPASPLGRGAIFLVGTSAILYGLFQKKLLPRSLSKIVSKILFWPTLPLTLALRWGNLFTQVDNTLVLGTAPVGLLGHVDTLNKMGVKGVINMCCEYEGPQSYYHKYNIKHLRLPTIDHFEPSLEFMVEAVEFIRDYKSRGEKVYVHCKAGHGRAAAIALCWLMHENRKISARENNVNLNRKRKVRPTLFKQMNIQQFKAKLEKGELSTS